MLTFEAYLRSNSINWTPPNLEDEAGEYFENPATHTAFKTHGYIFKGTQPLVDFMTIYGKLVPITRSTLASRPENLTVKPEDFHKELEDPEYRDSYREMEAALASGPITLPAPIIWDWGTTYYGFSGNRRTNLAWNHGVPLKVWLVTPPARQPKS